jgi:hypothetical protein
MRLQNQCIRNELNSIQLDKGFIDREIGSLTAAAAILGGRPWHCTWIADASHSRSPLSDSLSVHHGWLIARLNIRCRALFRQNRGDVRDDRQVV